MVLQSIPCSLECKIVRTVIKVPGLEETIKFMLNTQQFVFTMDMFRDIIQLRVETPKILFLAPVNIETIEVFMNKVGYQGAVDKIEKLVEGDEDEESYASEFADLVFNDDVDDSGTRLEPESHKENLEKVGDDDDEEIEKEKKDDIEIVKEKKDDVVKEKYIVDDVTGSTENKKKKKQTPISSPTRSPRNVSSSDKTISEELTATVSPTTATTSKASSTTKRKKQSISSRSKTLPGSIAGMCRRRSLIRSHIKNKFITHDFFMSKIHEVLDHCKKVVPDITFEKTKEMITQEMPRLVNLVVNKDRKVDPINAKEMIAKEFSSHGPKND
nr:hypothetical protein [Tanacetum cinerariifolium]